MFDSTEKLSVGYAEVASKGKALKVPALQIGSRTITCIGRWLKVASIMDEPWLERDDSITPELMISQVKGSQLNADLFVFAQRFNEGTPAHSHLVEWDNVAAAPTASFSKWWEQLPQVTRKNVRRAARSGVEVREVVFDDDLVSGISAIYNSDPLRQNGVFWHYGKSLDVVKKENSSYLDRSCFLGAYVGEELVGFIKMVYVDGSAWLMQIVAKNQHRDKRPMNALVAKAVEVCDQKKMAFLVYGKYVYGNKTQSSLIDFKRHNGFEQMRYPRYYVPLTTTGKLALKLGAHRGLLGMLPPWLIGLLVEGRRRMLRTLSLLRGAANQVPRGSQDD